MRRLRDVACIRCPARCSVSLVAALQARARLNDEGNDEAHFLAPLEETVARGKTAAGELLDLYHGRWNGSIDPVFDEYAY